VKQASNHFPPKLTCTNSVRATAVERVTAHVNRKKWWHVPPADPWAYSKRGKFLASSFREAEFYGRPLDEPQKVSIKRPLIGDERAIARTLGVPPQDEWRGGCETLEEIGAHDRLWSDAAVTAGFDCIVLMAPKGFARFMSTERIPRSLELNIFEVGRRSRAQRKPAGSLTPAKETSRS